VQYLEPEIETGPALHIVGVLDEDVRGTRGFEIYVRPEDKVQYPRNASAWSMR